MTRPMRHSVMSVRLAVTSNSTRPVSSISLSANASETDEIDPTTKKQKSFPFLSLPSELRNRIYKLYYLVSAFVPQVIDLDPSTFSLLHRNKIFALFSVSRQLHNEATHQFFSSHTFRLFPTYPGHYFKTKKPLLARLPSRYRSSITTLELRLGPGWNNPPRGWVVNDALGLADCTSVRVLKVFVEFDPSDAFFKGFRAGDGFYERFSQHLLEGVLEGVPSINVVEFDAWSSVKKNGGMISGLEEVVARFNKVVGWGPERGWDLDSDHVQLDAVPMHAGGKLSKSIAIFA